MLTVEDLVEEDDEEVEQQGVGCNTRRLQSGTRIDKWVDFDTIDSWWD